MLEVLLVCTLVAACAAAGLIAVMLVRERTLARESREELSRTLAAFGQSVSAQISSIAGLQSQHLSQSFGQVSERLEQVHRGLGEMRSLAAGVGDLKKVLANVKTRGVLGELQLGALLEQLLTPEQYQRNVATRPESRERVEFAVRLPGSAGTPVWLPIDAKFPLEDYHRLQEAQEAGDPAGVEIAAKALEARVRLEARSIAEKYLEPPATTDFALLYLPFEGLYAEVLRRAGLFEQLQRDHRVTVCGPTTLSALLNSLQMGFRTLAIEKRSSEVWKVLGGVKTELARFAELLASARRQLQSAANSIEQAEVRTRQIERRLKDAEIMPEEPNGVTPTGDNTPEAERLLAKHDLK
jgi:DNA recombination protein RmuC